MDNENQRIADLEAAVIALKEELVELKAELDARDNIVDAE